MAAAASAIGLRSGAARFEANTATRDPRWIKFVVLTLSLGFFATFLLLPLAAVFVEAFRRGWSVYIAALVEPDALSAVRLTLLTAAIAVPSTSCSALPLRGPSPSSTSAASSF